MTRRKRLIWLSVIVLILALICSSVWFALYLKSIMSVPPIKLALSGSGTRISTFQITNGNLFVETPQPAVIFGTLQKGEKEFEFVYIIVVKYPLKKSDKNENKLEFSGGANGRIAECKDAIEVNGQRIETRYRIELNEAKTQIDKEELSLNGQSIQPGSNLVFLYDLSAVNPVLLPLPIERPRLTHSVRSTSDVEQIGRSILAELKDHIP